MALVATTWAGVDVSHRHSIAGAPIRSSQVAAAPAVMPTIEIHFKLTSTSTDIGTSGSSTIDASATTIGVADSNIWSLDTAGIDQDLDELQSIGVTSVRLPIPWTYIEPTSGTYDWTQMDTIIAAAQARGMSIVGTITGNPSWDGTTAVGQPNAQAYASFAAAVASRYSTEISAFEVWNEENSQGFFAGSNAAAAYTAVLKAAYTAIKAVDPTATVIAGGLASVATIAGLEQSPESFLSQILADGAAGYFDAIAYHPYNLGTQLSQGGSLAESPLNQLTALRADLNAYGLSGIQIWATEYGEPTTPGMASAAQQAAYIENFIVEWEALSKTLNLGPAYLYTTRDTDSGALSDEANYGLFYTDGTPKPAALIVQQLEYDLQNNIPLPSLASTLYTLSPGQQVAFVISEALQWVKTGVTTVQGFAAFIAGAALSTLEAVPVLNTALAAMGAVLGAVGELAPVKAALAAVTSVMKTLGSFKDQLENAAMANFFTSIINTVNAVAGVGATVAAAIGITKPTSSSTSSTTAASAAADSTSATTSSTGAATTPASASTATPSDATATTPAVATTQTPSVVSAAAVPAATAVVTSAAGAAAASSASAAAATPSDSAAAAPTSAAADTASGTSADSSTTDDSASSDDSKSAHSRKKGKAVSASASASTSSSTSAAASVSTSSSSDQKSGKHRRADGQRGTSNGPGKHRK